MKPHILLLSFVFFFFCLGVHVTFWRLQHPKRHALTLISIFSVPLLGLLPFSRLLWPDLSWVDVAAVGLLHLATSCAYIQIYPASQADSPSLKILLLVEKSMPAGMTERQIQALFSSKQLLEERVQDLLDSGLVNEHANNLELTTKGHMLILPFIVLRRLIGLPAGQG